MDDKLKNYMEEHFCFNSLKRVKFFDGIKFNDYEAQAKKVCDFFGLDSIYEYHKLGAGTRFHISYAKDPNGFRPSVEVMGGKMHNSDGGKVIELNKRGK